MVHKQKLAALILPLILNILLPLLIILFRCTWIWLTENQSKVFSAFQTFLNEIKTQFDISMRAFYNDSVGEFSSNQFPTVHATQWYLSSNFMSSYSSTKGRTPMQKQTSN